MFRVPGLCNPNAKTCAHRQVMATERLLVFWRKMVHKRSPTTRVGSDEELPPAVRLSASISDYGGNLDCVMLSYRKPEFCLYFTGPPVLSLTARRKLCNRALRFIAGAARRSSQERLGYQRKPMKKRFKIVVLCGLMLCAAFGLGQDGLSQGSGLSQGQSQGQSSGSEPGNVDCTMDPSDPSCSQRCRAQILSFALDFVPG